MLLASAPIPPLLVPPTHLLLLGIRVVEDHRHVALPPQVTEDTVILHAEGQRFVRLVVQISARQGRGEVRIA